ncbi:MAG: hypothetical protein RMX57_02710 [Planktomarina sp.]|nr:hypothetical protein [Planktomarina sp.]
MQYLEVERVEHAVASPTALDIKHIAACHHQIYQVDDIEGCGRQNRNMMHARVAPT